MTTGTPRPAAGLLLAACLWAAGCVQNPDGSWELRSWQDDDPQPIVGTDPETDPSRPDLQRPLVSAAISDTVGSVLHDIRGQQKMRVRGYGVVVGLGDRGSRECPTRVKDYLLKEIRRRRHRMGVLSETLGGVTAEQFLASLDTAPVVVYGEIPAGVKQNTRFDVMVEAIPGTQTTDLEGGTLYTCELKVFIRRGGDRTILEGRSLALAAGPIFVNPFADKPDGAERTQRRGYVLGGGISSEDRRLSLVLLSPSYRVAVQVRDRVNGRFGGFPPTADATSPSLIELTVPDAWAGREAQFVALINHLYLRAERDYLARRRQELAEEMGRAGAPHRSLSLALEGMGRPSLPVARRFYAHRNRSVSFYAARAGLRLHDAPALEVIAQHAADPQSPYREQAVRELGRTRVFGSAVSTLRNLLDADDQRIRLAAYESLREYGDPAIHNLRVGRENFELEIVDAAGAYLIYAYRSQHPRLVLFGRDLEARPPMLYPAGDLEDRNVLLSADGGDRHIRLIRKNPYTHQTSDPMEVGLRVDDLILKLGNDPVIGENGEVNGLGLSYSQTVRVVSHLCRSGGIPAEFVLQTPSLDPDALTPVRYIGRPDIEE